MIPDDFRAFQAELRKTAEVYGKTLSREAVMFYFEDLAPWPIDRVIDGMKAHRRHPERGRFMPRPADIIAAMPVLEWWQKPTPPHPDLPSERKGRRAISGPIRVADALALGQDREDC